MTKEEQLRVAFNNIILRLLYFAGYKDTESVSILADEYVNELLTEVKIRTNLK